MRTRQLLLALLTALLVSCKDKDKGEPFVGLSDLCPRVAADICAAREHCMCEAGLDRCMQNELARCEGESEIFEDDDDLDYDAESAARVLSEQSEALQTCDPPFPLGEFFEGTRAEGADCERDSQCESGSCAADAQICQGAEVIDLCPAP